jgi:hypothetical protein
MINVYEQPVNVITTSEQWWFIVNNNKGIIESPVQSFGATSSPYTMIVADTLEECEQYIIDHGYRVVSVN